MTTKADTQISKAPLRGQDALGGEPLKVKGRVTSQIQVAGLLDQGSFSLTRRDVARVEDTDL